MESSYHYHTILLFLYVLRLYMHKALDTQNFQFIKKENSLYIIFFELFYYYDCFNWNVYF